ncbi:MAG: choice-of-anchor Q domain-containing protein [Cyanobacteriota bacterium]|nr:choice-of-anchor Q domain-containing protein [Cyanobacteriota bacterium]
MFIYAHLLSIIAGNIDSSNLAPDVFGSNINGNARNPIGSTVGLSGSSTLGTGSDIVNPDPGLAPLGDYGGSTQTHALLPGSPALNAGNNALIPPGVTTDQRGAERILNETVDIGAFESQGFSLVPIDGDNQSTTVDTVFATNLRVQLIENFTQSPLPFAGLNITFTPPTSGASGSFSTNNIATTDASGIATANPLTANTVAGAYQIIASATSIEPAAFNLTNAPDVPNVLEIASGNNQSTLVTTPFATPLSVRVSDRFGNPVPSTPVGFNAPANGASGSFDHSDFVTDALGILRIGFTANRIDGTYQVVAEVTGLLPVLFDLTNEPVPSSFNPIQPNEIEPLEVEKPLDINLVAGLVGALTLDTGVAEVEERFTPIFENYFGLGETSTTNLEQAQQVLNDIEVATGVKPALIYAFFVPATLPGSESDLSTTRLSSRGCPSACDPRAESLLLSDSQRFDSGVELPSVERNFTPQPSDRLELVLVTASGQSFRYPVGVTREQVLQEVQRLRNAVVIPVFRRDYLAPAQQMYRWLVAPLEEDLQEQNINNLVFILDSGLRSLPLAAMHDGDGFIVERYSVGLMPSLSLTDTRYVSLRGSSVLAMGAETFAEQKDLPAVPIYWSGFTMIGSPW